VRIVDQTGASTEGCLLHGAVLLASLAGGRVYPLGGAQGSAIEVFRRAQTLPAFDFLTDPGVALVDTANEAADSSSAAAADDRDGSGTTAVRADRPSRRACSQRGNARSSRWTWITVSTARGDA